MGKWGDKSKWAKSFFVAEDPLYMHRLRSKSAARTKCPQGSALVWDPDDGEVPFRCRRCGSVVRLPRILATGRPDPALLLQHLEESCSAGVTLYSNAVEESLTKQTAANKEDFLAVERLLQRPHVSDGCCDVWIGMVNPKTPQNMGSALRAMSVYDDGAAVLYTGNRYDIASRFSTDPHGAGSNVPKVHVHSLEAAVTAARSLCGLGGDSLQRDVRVVAVDLIDRAVPLHEYTHPDIPSAHRASLVIYVFGPEDGTLSPALLNMCDDAVFVPTRGSMNLAATINVLLYDRQAKRFAADPETLRGASLRAKANRSVNNHLDAGK